MAITKLAILPLVWAALAAGQDYTGPSVLSRRGGGGGGTGPRAALSFRPFLSLTSSLETGSPFYNRAGLANPAAELSYGTLYGGDAVLGLIGGRAWRKTSLNLNFNGNFRKYTGNSARDGNNEFLQFTATRRLTRRLTASLGGNISSFTGGNLYFGNPGQENFIDRGLGGATPQTEILNGRVNSIAALVDVTFQKSARLSFNGGVDRFSTKRSGGEIGVNGNRARGDAVYRLTRRINVGMDYSVTRIDYTRTFGRSSIQTLRASFATRLGRSWEVSTQAGISRVYTLGVERVEISPEVAAIIGQTFGFDVAEKVTRIPDVAVRLTRTFRRASLSFSYARGATPGNGVILTSRQQNFDAGFSYTAVKKWNFGANAGFNENDAIGVSQGVNAYTSKHAGGGATYQLRRYLFLNMQTGYQKFSGANLPIQANSRNQFRASVGLSFSPGDQPLALR